MNSNHSIQFFDAQFQQQARDGDMFDAPGARKKAFATIIAQKPRAHPEDVARP